MKTNLKSLLVILIIIIFIIIQATNQSNTEGELLLPLGSSAWFIIMDKAIRYTNPSIPEKERTEKVKHFGKKAKKTIRAIRLRKKVIDYFTSQYIIPKIEAPNYQYKKYKKCKSDLKDLNIIMNKFDTLFKRCKELAALYDKDLNK